jgi:hypothetical protein
MSSDIHYEELQRLVDEDKNVRQTYRYQNASAHSRSIYDQSIAMGRDILGEKNDREMQPEIMAELAVQTINNAKKTLDGKPSAHEVVPASETPALSQSAKPRPQSMTTKMSNTSSMTESQSQSARASMSQAGTTSTPHSTVTSTSVSTTMLQSQSLAAESMGSRSQSQSTSTSASLSQSQQSQSQSRSTSVTAQEAASEVEVLPLSALRATNSTHHRSTTVQASAADTDDQGLFVKPHASLADSAAFEPDEDDDEPEEIRFVSSQSPQFMAMGDDEEEPPAEVEVHPKSEPAEEEANASAEPTITFDPTSQPTNPAKTQQDEEPDDDQQATAAAKQKAIRYAIWHGLGQALGFGRNPKNQKRI